VIGGRARNNRGAVAMSEALPGVSRIRRGRPWASATAWILVVRPPRELPIAWTKAPLLPRQQNDAL